MLPRQPDLSRSIPTDIAHLREIANKHAHVVLEQRETLWHRPRFVALANEVGWWCSPRMHHAN